jgi:hypothetical protein
MTTVGDATASDSVSYAHLVQDVLEVGTHLSEAACALASIHNAPPTAAHAYLASEVQRLSMKYAAARKKLSEAS